MFIGMLLRRSTKPACISVEIERAWARAAAAARPQPGLGLEVIEILRDRDRFPDREPAMQQHRHAAGRRVLADRGLRLGQVERDHDLLELDAAILAISQPRSDHDE